jgi:hypothetical protein
MGIDKGIDTEYYCVCCACLGKGIYWELILNVTMFVVSVLGGEYREELILKFTELCVSGQGNIERN